jgi:hypothetical protein
VDYDASLSDLAGAILDYFQGVHQGMIDAGGGSDGYQIGVYGSGAACDFMTKHCEFVSYSWLAESTGWLGSRNYAAWNVNQAAATIPLCGFTADDYEENRALDDFGGFTLDYAAPFVLAAAGRDPGLLPEVTDHGLFLARLAIDDLNLSPTAKGAANLLHSQLPDLLFTSGRRDVTQQAQAMANNVVKNRAWIRETYRAGSEQDSLQEWIDSNPAATTATAIARGLAAIMLTWNDDQKRQLSRHFSGDAFDVQPVAGPEGDVIKSSIKRLPKLRAFLDTEGGLVIWHAEFEA